MFILFTIFIILNFCSWRVLTESFIPSPRRVVKFAPSNANDLTVLSSKIEYRHADIVPLLGGNVLDHILCQQVGDFFCRLFFSNETALDSEIEDLDDQISNLESGMAYNRAWNFFYYFGWPETTRSRRKRHREESQKTHSIDGLKKKRDNLERGLGKRRSLLKEPVNADTLREISLLHRSIYWFADAISTRIFQPISIFKKCLNWFLYGIPLNAKDWYSIVSFSMFIVAKPHAGVLEYILGNIPVTQILPGIRLLDENEHEHGEKFKY